MTLPAPGGRAQSAEGRGPRSRAWTCPDLGSAVRRCSPLLHACSDVRLAVRARLAGRAARSTPTVQRRRQPPHQSSPASPTSHRRPDEPRAGARHRPAGLARHPGPAAAPGRLRRGAADPARAAEPAVHAARHGRAARPATGSRAVVEPVPPDVLARSTWQPDCPVSADELRWVRLTFWGFDDARHTGELLVNSRVADDVVAVFRTLYAGALPDRGDADHPARRARRPADRRRQQHRVVRVPADDRRRRRSPSTPTGWPST